MKKSLLFILLITAVMTATAQNGLPTVTASGVVFRYCLPTTGSDAITLIEHAEWHGYAFDSTGVYTRVINNVRGCDSTVTLNVKVLQGTLPGKFSVSPTQQVYFSKGNLQYCAVPSAGQTTHKVMGVLGDSTAQGVWRFASSQLDFEGTNNQYASATYLGWIDVFGFGTSGWKSDAREYEPYATSNTDTYYTAHSLEGDYMRSDWGVFNAISNGDNVPGRWFTPSYEQMDYLFNKRTDAALLYSAGTVNGITGCILLPDSWTWPENVQFTARAGNFTTNNYTLEQWNEMEQMGAVFLTCSNRRNGTTIDSDRYYWLRTTTGTSGAYIYISNSPSVGNSGSKSYARAVRLVRWVE